MVHYKLIYFNLRGRAELSRLILHHQGVQFEDYRFQPSEWPTYKPSNSSIQFEKSIITYKEMCAATPFGQVPVLEVDGKPLAQSNTIARYLARQHGLAGKTAWEESQADMFVDCISDLVGGTASHLTQENRVS